MPSLSPNVKINRGFNHEVTGALLCPAGMNWSDIMYVQYIYVNCTLFLNTNLIQIYF